MLMTMTMMGSPWNQRRLEQRPAVDEEEVLEVQSEEGKAWKN
jgi:hypothetical protein